MLVTNQLSFVGVNFDDEVRDLIILCSFLERWNGLVMVVSNSVPGSNTLKFDDVVRVNHNEEMRRKIIGETLGNALTMEIRGRQIERGRIPCNYITSINGISKSRIRKIECWNYGKR